MRKKSELIDSLNAFLALLRAGLWEKEARLINYGLSDLSEVYRLSSKQAVTGLVTAGLEHVSDVTVPEDVVLKFVGPVLRMEQRNHRMNVFASWLTSRLRQDGIAALLVKGQGIAQCYERPLWRAAGDIDLVLGQKDYQKAKSILAPLGKSLAPEEIRNMHYAVSINGFDVELHGKMRFELSKRVDRCVDSVLKLSFNGEVRVWRYCDEDLLLPAVNNDIIIIFTHFLHHFFIEGVGLRQICDWCRLLWTYKDIIDRQLLEDRLREMGLMSEWRVFAALAVEWLDMPEEAMPFYKRSYGRKAYIVLKRILKSGNFGHNNDVGYRSKKSRVLVNTITLFRRIWDFTLLFPVFPLDSPKFFVAYLVGKMR